MKVKQHTVVAQRPDDAERPLSDTRSSMVFWAAVSNS
jgi:hypothetical protein